MTFYVFYLISQFYNRLSVMERKIQYLESKVEMNAHNPDMMVGGDRVVIGAPIVMQQATSNPRDENGEPLAFDEVDDSPTRDEISYTEEISGSLAC